MPTDTEELRTIDPAALETVAGGAARASGDADISAALTAITSSIKDLASQKNNNSMDPMQLMLMMMMFGGGGGGGVAAAPGVGVGVGATPVINVDTAVAGGGCRPKKGKKGW